MFENILSKCSIGSLEIKNRFVVPPMVSNMFTSDGIATPQYVSYIEARAKGGFGLIITENFGVTNGGRAFPLNGGLWNEAQRDGLSKIVEKVHATDAKICAQLYHAGRETCSQITGENNCAPSPYQDPTVQEPPKELTIDEIDTIIQQFGKSALLAKQAGFDAIEVHCAHGYLINQFLSPFSNKRTDEYGGPLYNRARFMLEVIGAVKKSVNNEIPVLCRISVDELVEGGLTQGDMKAVCLMLKDHGVDAIDVSFGVFASGGNIAASYYEKHAFMTNFAEAVKKTCSIPVIAVGRIHDPLIAEAVIASGQADFIAFGRGSIADPQLPNKIRQGNIDSIAYCMGCRQVCNVNLFSHKPLGCLMNPESCNEYLNAPEKLHKKILVIGGGLAGMQFAISADKRGAKVTLVERTEKLGGQWLLAMVPPFKQEYANLITYLKYQLSQSKVNIILNCEASADLIQDADIVVDATGSVQKNPKIPINTTGQVVLEKDVLSGNHQVDKAAYVIDFGGTAANTAVFLKAQGKNTTLITQNHRMEKYGDDSLDAALKEKLSSLKVNIIDGTKVLRIDEDLIVMDTGTIKFEKTDSIVVCTRHTKDEYPIADADNLIRIGDAKAVGNAVSALKTAYNEAIDLA